MLDTRAKLEQAMANLYSIISVFQKDSILREEFRNLATNKYMPYIDYTKWYGFQTVFYESSYSYVCCPCGFQHEFLDYRDYNGNINEEVIEKIIKNIEAGKCPHVDNVPGAWVRDTGLTALLIAAGVGTEPTQFTQPTLWLSTPRLSEHVQTGLFKQNLYQIAFNKKSYKNCRYYFQHYINDYVLNGFFSETIPKLHKPIETAEIYQVNHEPCIEAFVRSGNKSLLETALGLTAEFGERIQIRYCRESEAFHYMVKHNLTEFVELFLEYVKQTNDPSLTEYCKRYGNIYYQSKTLNSMLEEKLPEINPKESSRDRINILKKQNQCRKKLRDKANEQQFPQALDNNLRNGSTSTESDLKEIVEVLDEFYEDFKSEIIAALKQIPNVKEECRKYIDKHLTYIAKKPHLLKIFLDLGVYSSDSNTATEYRVLTRIVENLNMYTCCVRDTISLLVRACEDLELLVDIVPFGLSQDICTWGMDPERAVSRVYRADFKEHGLFVGENGDFALNFAVPFLLECGIPASRHALEGALKADLHPAENAYIYSYMYSKSKKPLQARYACKSVEGLYQDRYAYIEEVFDKPKPLQIICREVLHTYHKGARIDYFMEKSGCPQTIKEFVLLKNLHHRWPDADIVLSP